MMSKGNSSRLSAHFRDYTDFYRIGFLYVALLFIAVYASVIIHQRFKIREYQNTMLTHLIGTAAMMDVSADYDPLSHLESHHLHFPDFKDSSEIRIVELQGNAFHTLHFHRHDGHAAISDINVAAPEAGLFQAARLKKTGKYKLKNNRGGKVVGAFAYAEAHDWLLFGQTDVSDITAPYTDLSYTLCLFIFLSALLFIPLSAKLGLKSIAQAKAILENSSDALITIDANGDVVEWNPQAVKLFGWTKQEAVGSTLSGLIVPHNLRSKHEAGLRSFSAEAQSPILGKSLELPALHKNGRQLLVEMTIVHYTVNRRLFFTASVRDITRRKKIENRAFEFGQLLELSSNEFYIVDAHTHKFLRVNKTALDNLGYRLSELREMTPTDLDPAFTHEAIKVAFRDLLSHNKKILNLQATHHRKDATTYPANVQLTLSQYNGEPVIVASVMDRSDIKQVQSDLSLFQEMTQHAGDSFYVIDPTDARILYANDEASRILGYSEKELGSMTAVDIDDIFHDNFEEWRHMVAILKKDLEEGLGAREVRGNQRRKDGTRLPVEVRARLYRHTAQDFVIASVRDVSKRQEMEREMKRLTAALEQTAESVVITDTDGTIIYVNPAFTVNTGYSKQEAIGANPRILKSEKQKPIFYKRLWDTISAGKTWRGIFVNKRKDGTTIHEESSISPLKDEAGNITHYVALKRDISKTMELQERMAQSEKLASAGEIAAGVAHEVNNPLTVILGIAQIMKEEPDLPKHVVEDIETIVKHARRAGKITQSMLAFSRKRTPNREPHDLKEVVNSVVPLIKHELVKNKISLKLACGLKEAWSNVDPEQIHEILINLKMNAKHAMEKSEKKELEIRIERDLSTHSIRVSDTGSGIPENQLSKIFDPFFTTKPVGKGTGLGLSVCYGIAVDHGGTLTVESELGKGTIFTLELPVYKPAKLEPQPHLK